MRGRARMLAMAAVGAIGMASALAIGAGASDIRACVSKSGVVRPAGPTARCSAGQSVLTISGDAFKAGKRGTITINGVPFRKSSSGRVITINGNSFRSGTLPNTLTINGTAFRTGTLPNSLTINGTSFRSSGNTLTINGTAFGPGAAVGPQGVAGPEGKPGPAGPSGVPHAPAFTTLDGPITVTSGTSGKLVSVQYLGTQAHRLQAVGGFDAVCNPCAGRLTPGWDVRLDGAAQPLVTRRLAPVGDSEHVGASISDFFDTPDVCGPCTFTLSLVVPSDAGGQPRAVSASAIRLALVDLGPVAP